MFLNDIICLVWLCVVCLFSDTLMHVFVSFPWVNPIPKPAVFRFVFSINPLAVIAPTILF